ncbi:hypothetical protein [Paenibacillus sp. NPDC058174]|uniref:hypothetical protein n=1 Tax=Paenibacillus sp. NPDC058174 TaxID=3346366 RepID=UPI0036DD5D52
MNKYRHCVIKSFKHDGHLHRTWQRNWLVPNERLAAAQRDENMIVLINRQTPIQEADGKLWISRVPAVSFLSPENGIMSLHCLRMPAFVITVMWRHRRSCKGMY